MLRSRPQALAHCMLFPHEQMAAFQLTVPGAIEWCIMFYNTPSTAANCLLFSGTLMAAFELHTFGMTDA